METMFPLYSLFGFIVLHMLFYAGNIFFWKKYKVNYQFIFGFKAGTELGYRAVLLVSFGLSVLTLASIHTNLDMEMDPKTKDYKQITELVPLILVIFIFAIMICPFNIVYHSSRYFFLTCVVHVFLTPLYKVMLLDFFVADQLPIQVQAFRSIEFYTCYYTSGDYKHRENSCNNNDTYSTFGYILATVPFWWRMLQAWAVSGGSESVAVRFHDLIPDKALDFSFELDAFLAAIAITGAHNTPNTSQLVVVFPYPLASILIEDKKTVNKVTNAGN